jgi:transcriptional regulator with GAF, ATPase, and Fis domain
VPDREGLLAQTFVDISDTLVADFDVVEFLAVLAGRCVELLDVAEAGLMLADPSGTLRVAASSSHKMNLLELLELQHEDGPCTESYRRKAPVGEADLSTAVERWPRFVPEALDAGFHSAYALPMRLRDDVIGALNLLRVESGAIDPDDLVVAQALADVATIGILQHRTATENKIIAEQLQYALNSRVLIEQAKGVLGAQADLSMDDAFEAMRSYARSSHQNLTDVARDIAGRGPIVDEVLRLRRS